MTDGPGADTERLLDAITALLPPILNGMDALAHVSRHLHPPNLALLAAKVAGTDQPIRDALPAFREADWPEHLKDFSKQVEKTAEHVCEAFEGIAEAAGSPEGPMRAYRAMRGATRATESLYVIAGALPPVSRFFVEPGMRDDEALLEKLAKADARRDNVGVMHASNARGERGGFSMYVPEYYDGEEPWPLVMALHGGSGHGADFLWTWLREARSRGAILVSPTARGRTWSLMGPDVDSGHLDTIVEQVCERWNVDRDRLLLTGMSDGGTFAYVSGLRGDSPFTHLAPSSASFHPMLLDASPADRLKGLRVYLIHGVLDWMFPVEIARTANAALTAAGADVVYREIEDLSHTYPRDENPRIMDWLLGESVPPTRPA